MQMSLSICINSIITAMGGGEKSFLWLKTMLSVPVGMGRAKGRGVNERVFVYTLVCLYL